MLPKFRTIFKISASKRSIKNKLISYSLMWMGLGVTIIFLMSYLILAVPEISNIFIQISNKFWFILLIMNIGLIMGLTFLSHKLSLKMLVSMYVIFILVEGLFLSTTLYYFGFGISDDGMKNLVLLFLAPSLIFFVMGLLGWFQIFDFSKIAPFLFFATIGLIVSSILLLFLGGQNAEKWYSLLGIVIFSLWIGFDIWWIQRTATELESSSGSSNEELIRIGLLFGIRLFIDFVNLLIYFARLIR